MHPHRDPGQLGTLSHARHVAIIPARYDSTRLPGKPLADIGGRPMIEHVYRRASEAAGIDAVLVATDDERVREAVEAFGGVAWMTSRAHRSGSDRLAEVAAHLSCDLVVNVQGDEPLLAPEMVSEALEPLRADADIPMGTLCRPLADTSDLANPNIVKVVRDQQGFALYFSRAPIPYARAAAQGLNPAHAFKHIGLYVYRRAFLMQFARLEPTPLEQAESLEQLRALEHGYRIKTVITQHDSVGVDTPDDLERVRRLVAARLAPDKGSCRTEMAGR